MKTQCILKVWKESSVVQAEPIHCGLKLCQIDACGLVSKSPLSHSRMSPRVERRAVDRSGVEQSRGRPEVTFGFDLRSEVTLYIRKPEVKWHSPPGHRRSKFEGPKFNGTYTIESEMFLWWFWTSYNLNFDYLFMFYINCSNMHMS